MGKVNAIEELQREIENRLEDARISVDAPDTPNGTWWVDVEHEGKTASVEFRHDKGFGVSGPRGGGYGEGPDIVVTDASTAVDRLLECLAFEFEALEGPIRATEKS